MGDEKLQEVIATLQGDGYVVIENAVSDEPLDVLQEKMDEDTRRLMAADKWGGAGAVEGHLQQGPPPHAPYMFPEIVANPFAVQVTKAVLGEGVYNAYYNGNTNTPGSGLQPLHRDALEVWPGWKGTHPATTLVVNIPLGAVTEGNGATEIWPGSHRVAGELNEEQVEQQRANRPPIRLEISKGSVVIRDIRLWHRGVPHESSAFRHMLAMVHQVRWFRRLGKLRYQTGCEDAFVAGDLDHNAEFVDGPIDYLFGPLVRHSW